MGTMSVLFGRCTPRDMGVDDDQGRSVALILSHVKGDLELFKIICIRDTGNVPSVGDEAGSNVFGERPCRVALD